MACFVVLNKVDMLADPLHTDEQERGADPEAMRGHGADAADAARSGFPVSARAALHARLNGDDAALVKSRLPKLGKRRSPTNFCPRGSRCSRRRWCRASSRCARQVNARLRDQRRQNSEQLLELRGLRGKSGARVRHLLDRVQEDAPNSSAASPA